MKYIKKELDEKIKIAEYAITSGYKKASIKFNVIEITIRS
jgi:hypothetical protein